MRIRFLVPASRYGVTIPWPMLTATTSIRATVRRVTEVIIPHEKEFWFQKNSTENERESETISGVIERHVITVRSCHFKLHIAKTFLPVHEVQYETNYLKQTFYKRTPTIVKI